MFDTVIQKIKSWTDFWDTMYYYYHALA